MVQVTEEGHGVRMGCYGNMMVEGRGWRISDDRCKYVIWEEVG